MEATKSSERVAALDILRGFALLGILTMNISLGLPGAARLVPTIAGGFSGANFVVWAAGFLLFDEKMISLFSMLFGAGILLIGSKSGGSAGRLFARRQLILLGIGLVHAYLIWEGDILVPYALCGLAVYKLRHLSPGRLLALAFFLWLPSVGLSWFFAEQFSEGQAAQRRIEASRAAGRTPAGADLEAAAALQGFRPSPAQVARLIEENRNSSWWSLVVRRAPETFGFQTIIFLASFFWTISARMLVGMALLKMDVLSGGRTPRFYAGLAMAGYSIGLPIVCVAMLSLIERDFDPAFLFRAGLQVNQFGSLFVAIGHASLLLWFHTTRRLESYLWLLGNVGRMALSNYLLQSIFATTFFYGYGLAQFGQWDRVKLAYLVFAIWAMQLALSEIWLREFRYGPVEWLWRSLSYGVRQPMREEG